LLWLGFNERKFFFIFLVGFFFLLSLPNIYAWCSDYQDWQYRRPITIDNSGNSETLTNYQLHVNVSYYEHMKSDFSDIRFSWYNESSGEEIPIPYWIESKVDGNWAYVWFKVPEIPGSGEATVYMYYGNSGASSESNGSGVFAFFDDFEDGDVAGWSYSGGGYLKAQSDDVYDGIYSAETFSGTGDHPHGYATSPSFTGEERLEVAIKTQPSNGYRHNYIQYYCSNIGSWTTLEDAFYDSWTKRSYDISNCEGYSTQIRFHTYDNANPASGAKMWFDNVFVRKYIDPEPSTSIGSEELNGFRLELIEPEDGYNSVGSYVNFTAYIESDKPLNSLTLNVGSYTYHNSTNLMNASNYTFENVWLPIGEYTWNMTLCNSEKCITSENRQLTISGANLTIFIRDENTKELITNETVYLTIYNALNGTVITTMNTTTGKVNLTLTSPLNYIVSAYTNESYTNSRRVSYLTSTDTNQSTNLYLLKDGLGSINYFIVRDSNGFPVRGAWVKITHDNEIIDYAVTDNEGRLASYLDPYKLYKIYAGYGNAQTETEFYGSAIVTHTIYLTLEVSIPEAIQVWFTPQGEVRENETAFLRIHIKNWRQVDNVTVLVFDDKAWLDVYENIGKTYEPHSYVYFFDLDNQNYSWCNASIDCYGDLNEVSWRITDTPVNDIGTTGKVMVKAYVYDVNGTLHEYGQYGIVIKVKKFLGDFLMLLSSEQRHLIGLFLVMIVTSLVAYNFNLTFTQAGYVAIVTMCFCVYIGLFDKKMIYLPILAFISLILWREVKG